MTLLQFLTCAHPKSHHFGLIWFALPQNCTYIGQVDTWQSLPELTQEIGDFRSEQTEISNVELGTSTNKVPASSLKGSEGVLDGSTSGHTSVLQVFSFQDQHASGNNNPQPNELAVPKSVDTLALVTPGGITFE